MHPLPRLTSIYTNVIVLLTLVVTSTGVRVSDIQVPALAVTGSTVQLSCSYEQRRDRPDPVYSVKWYRGVDQFYEYIPRNDPPVRVYPIPEVTVDEVLSEKASVVLTGLKKESSGTFRCEVVGDKPHFETDDDALNMTVIEVPLWGPEIQGPHPGSRVLPGYVVGARCLVGASDPLVDIAWFLNNEDVPTYAQIRTLDQTIISGKRIQASELEFVATEESFRRGALVITCEARIFSVFHKSTNLTLIHARQRKPAEFGWFSRGSSVYCPIQFMSTLILVLLCTFVL